MNFWTFLVITLGGPYEGYVSTLPYESVEACWEAAPVIEETLSLPIDMVQCVPSDVVSGSLRPMPNPFY
jgi:hypothetical protein